MKNYKFHLDTSSKKYHCPSCGKKTFVPYLDAKNNIVDKHKFGRCDRINNCAYHSYPTSKYQSSGNIVKRNIITSKNGYYFFDFQFDRNIINYLKSVKATYLADTKTWILKQTNESQSVIKNLVDSYNFVNNSKSIKYIDKKIIISTICKFNNNNFVQKLISVFGNELTQKAIKDYYIGTSKNGSTVFWYIDKDKNVCNAKLIKYDNTGHRDKTQNAYYQYKTSENHKICLFGEHLINDNKKIAIVESEKTAIVGSLINDSYTWIATGGAQMATIEKIQVLKNRDIILFPDADLAGVQSFNKLKNGLKGTAKSIIIKNLFKNDTGYDIADLIFDNLSIDVLNDNTTIKKDYNYIKQSKTDNTSYLISQANNILSNIIEAKDQTWHKFADMGSNDVIKEAVKNAIDNGQSFELNRDNSSFRYAILF